MFAYFFTCLLTVNVIASLYNTITLYLCLENAIAGTGAWDCLYSKSAQLGLINLQATVE